MSGYLGTLKRALFVFSIPLIVLLAAMLYINYYSGDKSSSTEEIQFKEHLKREIKAGKTIFPLHEMIDGEWDEVCVGNEGSKFYGKRPKFHWPPENAWIIGLTKKTGESVFYRMWNRDFYQIDLIGDAKCLKSNASLILKPKCTYLSKDGKCFDLIN